MGDGFFTRDRLQLLVLLVATAIVARICFQIVEPFMPALLWALALAVVGYPMHDWIAMRLKRADLAAGISVVIVAVALIAPTILVGQQLYAQGRGIVDALRGEGLRDRLASNPKLGGLIARVEQHINIEDEIRGATEGMKDQIGSTLKKTVWAATQLGVCLFALFFFFRDHRQIMMTLRSLVPLSAREVDEVFDRIRLMVRATVYGNVVVSLIQGTLGGLMYWLLGLPAPLLWAVATAMFSLVPMLGAFVIWAPAAVWLFMEGATWKGVVMLVWGALVVSSMDNFLYPVLVGKEIRLHTLPVFMAIIGGILVFGASGIVLGPVALAILLALVDVLRRRTIAGRPAEQPT